MPTKNWRVLVFTFLLASAQCFALSPSSTTRFTVLLAEQGLTIGSVEKIYQDSTGFIWLGGPDGLARYDGYRFELFRYEPSDTTSISNNSVWDILEDHRGDLWIATDGGLNRFERTTNQFVRYQHKRDDPNSLSSNISRSLVEDADGNLWVGTYAGLNMFDATRTHVIHYENKPGDRHSLVADQIKKIFMDHQGILWIGTDGNGLDRFDRSTKLFEHYQNVPGKTNSLSHNVISSITEDQEHQIWVGTDSGLNKLNPATGEFTRYLNDSARNTSISNNRIDVILEDHQNNIWIGTENGLNVIAAGTDKFTRIQHDDQNPQSLASNVVHSIFEDHNGDIWIGTFPAGVNFLDAGNMAFTTRSHVANDGNSLSNNSVLSILEDTLGKLWFGTDGGGLNEFDPHTQSMNYYRRNTDRANTLGSDVVLSIAQDDSTKLWLGTWGGGLSYFDPQTGQFEPYSLDNVKNSAATTDNIWKVFIDSKKILWAGTIGRGLNRYDPQQQLFTRFVPVNTDSTSISSNLVWSIYEDHQGVLWLGTADGLDRMDKNGHEFIHYRHRADDPDSLIMDIILAIHEDTQGYIWLGTRGGGLDKLNPATGKFVHYNQRNGLPSDVVVSIEEDGHGNLWLGTNNGLAKLNIASGKIRSYDRKNGLQGNQFNIGASIKLRSGELIFGGTQGYTQFYPDQVMENTYLPHVVIRDLQVLNKSISINDKDGLLTRTIDQTDTITLNYRQSVFALEFAALGFRHPERNQYAYRLVGFDKDWNYVGTKRSATYTNLNAGTYTFEVKAANNEGLWNDQSTTLQIRILPPPWKTWWAYSIYSMTFLLLMAAFVYSQQKKVAYERAVSLRLRNLDKLKDEFMANTSHELRTPLIGIIGLAESLMDGIGGEQSPVSKSNLAMIISSGQRLANLVNDILDFSKLRDHAITLSRKAVNLPSLVNSVLALTKPLVHNGAIELINNIPYDCPSVYADEDRLQQILLNLIGNAIKFTKEGAVTVSCSQYDDQLRIYVTDSGIGIAPDQFSRIFQSFEQLDGSESRAYGGTGLGLAVTRQLVQLHQGEIDVESTLGKGSTFHFNLPIYTAQLDTSAHEQNPAAIASLNTLALATDTAIPQAAIPKQNDKASKDEFHILVVDDEPINRQVLINHLSIEHYHISVAASGKEAIELIDNGAVFDLILLDIMMPHMSGYEVCQHLREKHSSNELPIIFLTAKNQALDLVTGFNAGANDFVTKPVSKAELLARVHTHLELLETNRKLEQKVAERTHELQEKNRDLELANQKLEDISLSDSLTGLHNRRFLYKTLPLDIARTLRAYNYTDGQEEVLADHDLLFFLLDIDHFKLVNDLYGHNNGDNILIQVAETLRKVCRDSDHIIRWGGEEFLIVSRFTGRDQAPLIAERIRRAIENHLFTLDSHISIRKTCSIGYASFPFNRAMPEAVSLEQTIDIADRCLYMVKHNQRNGWLGISQENAEFINIQELTEDPRKYIKGGQLSLKTSITGDLQWHYYNREQ